MAVRIVVAGAAGRMGQRVIALAAADSRFTVVAALDAAASGRIGQDAGEVAGAGRVGVSISESVTPDFDVLIDFSTAAATAELVEVCVRRQRAIVIGTTGHDAAQLAAIESASREIAVLKSANMSVGVNALLRAVEQVARALGRDYDVEIVETHHRFKTDAPSGTALALRDAIARGRPDLVRTTHGRSGAAGPRAAAEIGMHAVRCGDVVGEHDVRFSTLGETVVLRHVAHSRDTFARGALAAAAWLAGKPAGRYGMDDVIAQKS